MQPTTTARGTRARVSNSAKPIPTAAVKPEPKANRRAASGIAGGRLPGYCPCGLCIGIAGAFGFAEAGIASGAPVRSIFALLFSFWM